MKDFRIVRKQYGDDSVLYFVEEWKQNWLGVDSWCTTKGFSSNIEIAKQLAASLYNKKKANTPISSEVVWP